MMGSENRSGQFLDINNMSRVQSSGYSGITGDGNLTKRKFSQKRPRINNPEDLGMLAICEKTKVDNSVAA